MLDAQVKFLIRRVSIMAARKATPAPVEESSPVVEPVEPDADAVAEDAALEAEEDANDPYAEITAEAVKYTRGKRATDWEAETSPTLKRLLQESYDAYLPPNVGTLSAVDIDAGVKERKVGINAWRTTNAFKSEKIRDQFVKEGKRYAKFKGWSSYFKVLDDNPLRVRFYVKPKESTVDAIAETHEEAKTDA